MNRTVNKIVVLLIILLLLSVVIIVGKIEFNKKREIPLTFINSFPITKNIEQYNGLKWFSLRDPSYEGFYSAKILEDYGLNYSDFDFENYTYVVTIGHRLKKLEYSYSQTKNRKYFIIPKQFLGITTLDHENNNMVCLYKIKRMDIDCDYHNPDRNIFLD